MPVLTRLRVPATSTCERCRCHALTLNLRAPFSPFFSPLSCSIFLPRSEGRILFFDGAEFLSNVGTGSGGAILNHGELDFTAGGDDSSSSADDGSSEESTTLTFTLDFQDNYCGEQEVREIL